MRATKYILTLLFIVALTASAFGAWTSQESTTRDLNAIDGISTTSMTTLCAVGNGRTILISNDYGTNWTQTTIPGGMAADENVTDVSLIGSSIWLGTSYGNIHVSNDWGNSWTDRTPAGVFSAIYAIEFGSSNNGVVTGDKSGVFITRYTANAGVAWNTPTSAPGSTSMQNITATDANTFYIVGTSVALSDNIFKSVDGGDNWSAQTSNTTNTLYGIHFSSASTLDGYAVGRANTIRKTDDGGVSWEVVTSVGIEDFYGVYFTSVNTGGIVGVENSGSLRGKILSTTNGGSSWTDEYTGANNSSPIKDVYFTDTDNRFAVGTGASGIILGNIAPITLSSVVQTARPTQSQAYRGFTGNITITGTNFQRGAWGTGNVDFVATGITVNSVTWVSATQLTANITISDTAQLGDEDVDITNIDGTVANLAGGFTVTEKPTITNLDPSSGIQNDTITGLKISGTNFQSGITNSAVSFGSGITVSNVSRNSAFEITCDIVIAAAATTGIRDVTVTNPDGGVSAPFAFTVQSGSVTNPTITQVSPTSVTIGATSVDIDVTGTTFNVGIAATFETDGITINSVTRNSSTSLTINIDVGASAHTGPRAIIVRNTDGGAGSSADNNAYLYVMQAGAATPTITTLDPGDGYENTDIPSEALNGTNFENGATVVFSPSGGITINSISFNDSTQLILDITIDADAFSVAATRDVTVINPTGGFASKLGAFTIKQQASKSSVKGGRGLAYPSPWNPNKEPVNIQIHVDRDDILTIPVVTMGGRMIQKFILNANAGYNTFTWDGQTFTGHQVPAGMVLLPIVSTAQNKKIGNIKLMIVPWH